MTKNFVNLKIILLLILILFSSCSKPEKKSSIIKETKIENQVLEAYLEGMQSLESGDVLFAAKKFNEAELLFPQSLWAPKSAIMSAYSYYTQDYYIDAIAELERFLKVYSSSKYLGYANYLLALCYYEQIVDEKKDLKSIIIAKKKFELVKINFPNTDYALDASFKIDLINDILASKEMYIGRYYLKKNKWIAAINRFRTIVDEYDTTIYSEEALYRLVEIYYLIGLENEAKKYASLLGYNYLSSRWYEKSYSFFDKSYEVNRNKLEVLNKKKFSEKFKSLFD